MLRLYAHWSPAVPNDPKVMDAWAKFQADVNMIGVAKAYSVICQMWLSTLAPDDKMDQAFKWLVESFVIALLLQQLIQYPFLNQEKVIYNRNVELMGHHWHQSVCCTSFSIVDWPHADSIIAVHLSSFWDCVTHGPHLQSPCSLPRITCCRPNVETATLHPLYCDEKGGPQCVLHYMHELH